MSKQQNKMELAEKTAGSNYTLNNGFLGEMSSRLQILDCENGRSNGKPMKKQYDRSGHETGGGGAGGHGIQSDHPTSYVETLMHLLRGNIGAGVFGMGSAFKNGGIVLAPSLTILIGLIAVHCQHVLITCAKRMRAIQCNTSEKIEEIEDPDYAQTVELCFINGPPRLRKWSRFFKLLINIFISVTQMGFCCIYIVFVSTNFEQLWNAYVPSYEYNYLVKFGLVLFPVLAISMITELKYLAPLSTIANICMAAGVALTFFFAFQDLPDISERTYVGELKNMPLFFGTAIFAFEGIALVLPLKNAMKKPKLFARPSGVLNIGMVFVASLFILMGFMSYWKWGEAVEGTVTINLPNDDPLAQTVKFMVSLGLLMTYPLQFFVAIQIMWPPIEEKFGPLKHPLTSQLFFRALLVLLTYSLGEVVPALDAFISLIGALGSTGLALIVPAVIELVCASGTSSGISGVLLTKNSIILVVAMFGLVTGTYESLHKLVDAFFGHKGSS
ncbi:proton-coupled amino acid transporter-like protein CG1139 [Sitodiplosis mosellana]|uniref:proton-coupled amino acid transporter-like protein CG1139 n=1 Tax=Sitodiplosis mosellana TaxID=263140 RepID=UPI0024439B05|nr:proton-coupled amino acid transporter-like protein CG1139 [Sitodiplosis mosellana]